jgi:hypothetical protein
VTYTLYDEVALGLRRLTGLGFEPVLAAQQIVTRALGIWGILLLAESMGLGLWASFTVAAIASLGVVVVGPTVLTVEYEPTPRAFAIPLLLCAMGLTAHNRYLAAGIAASVATLYHAPTALPFWLCSAGLLACPPAAKRLFAPLIAAAAILLAAARTQPETQTFISHLTPTAETLQRMRASYVYISTWPWQTIVHYVLLFAVLIAAFLRVRSSMKRTTQIFLLGLPLLGMLSMPLSWLLLEQWKWGVVPQVQPMRMLLFVTLFAQILCAMAAARAGRSAEGAIWFTLAFLLSLQPQLTGPFNWLRIALAAGLGVACALAGRWQFVVALAAFFAIPSIGNVVNYPQQRTPELAQLSAWARTNTSKDAIFLFAGSPRSLDPGVFRSEALRAIYADWKGGGQVNYLNGFGEQWWFRWQQTLARKFAPSDLPRYEALGIRYVVLINQPPIPNQPPVYESPHYRVYQLH